MVARVLEFISANRLLIAGDRVGVAVSGGADSVALLRILVEYRAKLGIVVSAVHFNHGIRGAASDSDEQSVRELAARLGVEMHVSSGDTPSFAEERKLSLEAAARHLRYGFFRALIEQNTVNKIATAHTLDDQAETVLLRIVRGTGISGLAGIHPSIRVGPAGSAIVRPFLRIHRPEIERYLHAVHQSWCEDATNSELKYGRNRVRHTLLPILEREFNPSVRDRLAELADIALREDVCWQEMLQAAGEHLSVPKLASEHIAIQRRKIRATAARSGLSLDFREVEAVRELLDPAGPKRVELHQGFRAELCRNGLGSPYVAFRAEPEMSVVAGDYEIRLRWPGDVYVPQIGTTIRIRLVPLDSGHGAGPVENGESFKERTGYNQYQLLDPSKLSSELLVRNWRPGDRFWPAHRGSPKKVKELLQEKHVVGHLRPVWPVVVSGRVIVWMRAFPVSGPHRVAEDSQQGVLVEEIVAPS